MSLEPREAIALARLRQWRYERTAICRPAAVTFHRTGWQRRDNRHADARIVRVIDFERAFAHLCRTDQATLILEAEGHTYRYASRILACSERTAANHRHSALAALAAILEKLDLL